MGLLPECLKLQPWRLTGRGRKKGHTVNDGDDDVDYDGRMMMMMMVILKKGQPSCPNLATLAPVAAALYPPSALELLHEPRSDHIVALGWVCLASLWT